MKIFIIFLFISSYLFSQEYETNCYVNNLQEIESCLKNKEIKDIYVQKEYLERDLYIKEIFDLINQRINENNDFIIYNEYFIPILNSNDFNECETKCMKLFFDEFFGYVNEVEQIQLRYDIQETYVIGSTEDIKNILIYIIKNPLKNILLIYEDKNIDNILLRKEDIESFKDIYNYYIYNFTQLSNINNNETKIVLNQELGRLVIFSNRKLIIHEENLYNAFKSFTGIFYEYDIYDLKNYLTNIYTEKFNQKINLFY